jgi:hypothetical protein
MTEALLCLASANSQETQADAFVILSDQICIGQQQFEQLTKG